MSTYAKCIEDTSDLSDVISGTKCSSNVHYDCVGSSKFPALGKKFKCLMCMPAGDEKDPKETFVTSCSACGGSDIETIVNNIIIEHLENSRARIARKIDVEISKVNKKMQKLLKTVNLFSSKVDDCEKHIHQLNEKLFDIQRQVEAIITDRDLQRRELKQLETRIEELEQFSCLANLEIIGIPELPEEDLQDIFLKLAHALSIPYLDWDIVSAYRASASPGCYLKPIIAQFKHRALRQIWIDAVHMRPPILASEIYPHFPPEVIHINEHLTQSRKKILSEAKRLQREGKIGFVWIRNCKIFVRKEEGLRAVRISEVEDLSEFME